MAIPELIGVAKWQDSLQDERFDALVWVSPDATSGVTALDGPLNTAARVDARAGKDVSLLPAEGVPGGRLVWAPTGPLNRDYDDVRQVGDAARAGVERAVKAGARAPLVAFTSVPADGLYRHSTQVAVLSALAGLWQPLEAREARGAQVEPVQRLGFQGQASTAKQLTALEQGRRLARDLCGTEPERMRPEAFADCCLQAFEGTRAKVSVVSDAELLVKEYPMLSAVARASMAVPRHRPRVIRIELPAAGKAERTLLLAGKGVTYDTGGADLKTGGHMAGMSRDKGGGAAVAGFVRALVDLAPDNLRVVAEIGAVRNSAGADAFVTDEILTSHAGVRVRVGNTDAEGRLVLGDLLSHLRVEALSAPQPSLFSVATLTGHAGRAVGPYSIALDNGAAQKSGTAEALDRLGELWGDPFEISRMRREDFAFVQPRTAADDVLSCNNEPSSVTPRGHQFPAAFLTVASGLDAHGAAADTPLPYTHIDLGGSGCEGGDWQHGKPTAAPVVAMTAWALGW